MNDILPNSYICRNINIINAIDKLDKCVSFAAEQIKYNPQIKLRQNITKMIFNQTGSMRNMIHSSVINIRNYTFFTQQDRKKDLDEYLDRKSVLKKVA